MPVIPSFGAFAPAPKLAESMFSGIASSQRDTQEANQLAIANQHIQLAQQKLQQEAVQSNMELQAKQEAHKDDMMRRQHEMMIQDQYQKQMIGLKQQQLEESSKIVQMKTMESARKFQAQQAFKAEAEQAIQGGEEPETAYRQAAMKFGPEMGMTGPGMASLTKTASGTPSDFGQASAIPGLPEEQYKKVRTSSGGYHVVKLPPNMDTTGPAPAGYVRSGNRVLPEREPIEVRQTRKDISDLEKALDKEPIAQIAKFAEMKIARGDKPSSGQKSALETYKVRKEAIEKLRSTLPGAGKSAGKFKEGQVIRHKKTGEKYRVTNGVPVPVSAPQEETEEEQGQSTEEE